MRFMPVRDPWADEGITARNERESFAEQYVGLLVDMVRGHQSPARTDGTLEGALNALKGFVQNDPAFVQRVAGGRKQFERLKAVVAGDVPASAMNQKHEEQMTMSYMPPRPDGTAREIATNLREAFQGSGQRDYAPHRDAFAQNQIEAGEAVGRALGHLEAVDAENLAQPLADAVGQLVDGLNEVAAPIQPAALADGFEGAVEAAMRELSASDEELPDTVRDALASFQQKLGNVQRSDPLEVRRDVDDTDFSGLVGRDLTDGGSGEFDDGGDGQASNRRFMPTTDAFSE